MYKVANSACKEELVLQRIYIICIINVPLLLRQFPSKNLKQGLVRSLPRTQVQKRYIGIRRGFMAKIYKIRLHN